jgi:DNA-binding GntR family transcriptional regulator
LNLEETTTLAGNQPEKRGSGLPGEADSQVRQAYLALEERIATLALAPGQVLSETSLAAMLGLGRTPVREALQQLAREGLVAVHPKRGVVITEIDVKRQLKMLELRRYLERYVVEAAATHATAAERQRFREIADLMKDAGGRGDGEAFLALDREFNLLLLASARNEFATNAMKLIQGLARRFWYAYGDNANLGETARLHAEIARSVAEHEREPAVKYLDSLIDNVEEFTRSTLNIR